VAEYFAGIFFARQGKMDLVMSITLGGTIQVALFVAPLLVLVSYFIGSPMDLCLPIHRIDCHCRGSFCGRSHLEGRRSDWFEGALLFGVYALLAMPFSL
jgi:Ca2+:H+ antiporter